MYELLPLIAGGAIGCVAFGAFALVRIRVLFVLALSLGVGLAASSLSGELAESWLFLVWDAAQAAGAAAMVTVVRARHRTRSHPDRVYSR